MYPKNRDKKEKVKKKKPCKIFNILNIKTVNGNTFISI